jgi:hypothetical protein
MRRRLRARLTYQMEDEDGRRLQGWGRTEGAGREAERCHDGTERCLVQLGLPYNVNRA